MAAQSFPSTVDFTAPFDPTAYTQISGAQLLQLVTGLVPNLYHGMVLLSQDAADNTPYVPDADTNVKWQNYLWIRRSLTTTSIYIWNNRTTYDAVYRYWTPVGISSIGDGAILGAQLADNTITDAKISDVDWSKIQNAPAFVPPTASIESAQLVDGCVTPGKLVAGGGLVGQVPRIAASGAAMEFFTQKKIADLANPNASQIGYPVVVNADASGFTLSPISTGYIYQIKEAVDTTVVSCGTQINPALAITNGSNNGTNVPGLTLAITPASASSIITVEVMINGSLDFSAGDSHSSLIAILFDGLSVNPAAIAGASGYTNQLVCTRLFHRYVNADVNMKTFTVNFGPSDGYTYARYNGRTGYNFSNALKSYIRVIEHAL